MSPQRERSTVRRSPFANTIYRHSKRSESMKNLFVATGVNPMRTQQAIKQLKAAFQVDEDLTVRRLYGQQNYGLEQQVNTDIG